MITGLIKPDGGRIYLDNEDITALPMYKRAQKGLGYLAQEASVFRKLSVEDNLMAVMELSEMTNAERQERLDTLINEFSLQKVRQSYGIQLSGGERRRCEIARALAIDPKFILLDEPFAGVDPIAVQDIQHIIAELKTKNIGVIITDHNVYETLAITDRAYLLYEGSILYSGTPEELASNPDARRKYLGTNFDLRKAVLHDKKDEEGNPIPDTGNEGRYGSAPTETPKETKEEANNRQNKKFSADDYYDSKFSEKAEKLEKE